MKRWLCTILALLVGAAALAEEELPRCGRDLSFLEAYADAVQVGDWFLACPEAVEPDDLGRTTRNRTANWELLDEKGYLLADGLVWEPESDWPLMPRPFEGFEDGVDAAVIRIGQQYGLIDRAGNLLAEPVYDDIFGFLPGDALTPMSRGGKWGCLDLSGREAIPPRYDASFSRFSGGCTVVEHGGRYGLLGEDGTELLPAEYDEVWLEDEAEYGMAKRGGDVSLIDRRGNLLFTRPLGARGSICCFGDVEPPFAFNDDADAWGYLTPDGAEILPAAFEHAAPFWKGSDMATVTADGQEGMIWKNGGWAIEPMYDELTGFSEELCAASRSGGMWGYINARGETVIPFRFAEALPFQRGFAAARSRENGQGWGMIDPAGDWVIEPMYDAPIAVGDDGVAVASEDEIICFRRAGDDWLRVASLEEDGGEWTLPGRWPGAGSVLTEGEGLRVDGPSALAPLCAALAEAIRGTTGDGAYGTLEDVWEHLFEGKADVIVVPGPGPEDGVWASITALGGVEFIPLCREAVVFAVNADNPVTDISSDALARVYAGKIVDWAELGAEGLGQIVAYQCGENSAVRQAFDGACGFSPLMPAPEGFTGDRDWEDELVTGPVSYRNLPNAIGVSLKPLCRDLLEAGEIRLLTVDGVAPSDECVEKGEYPFVQTWYAVVRERD